MPRIQGYPPANHCKADPKPLSAPAIPRVLLNTISKFAQAFFLGFLLFSPASALTSKNKVEVIEDPSIDSFIARMQPFQDEPQRELSFWNTYPGKVLTEEGDAGCYLSYGFKTPGECSTRVNNYLSETGRTRPRNTQSPQIEHIYSKGKGDITLGIHPEARNNFIKSTEYLQEALFNDPGVILHTSPEELVEIIKTSHQILTDQIFDASVSGKFRQGIMMIPGIEKGKPQTVDNLIEIIKLRRNCSEQECMQLRSIITKHLLPGNTFTDVYRRLSQEEREFWHRFCGEFPLPEDIQEKLLQTTATFKQRLSAVKGPEDAIKLAAWIHHKLAGIQVFNDGNKRLAQVWMHAVLRGQGIENVIINDLGHYIHCFSAELRGSTGVFKKYLEYLIRWNRIIDPLQLQSEVIEFPDCSTSFSVEEYQAPPIGEIFLPHLNKRASARFLARWTMHPGRIFDQKGDSACTFYERNPHRARVCSSYIAKAKKGNPALVPGTKTSVEIPGKTTVFLGLDPSQLDNYEKTAEYLLRTFQHSLRDLDPDEIATKIKNACRLLFQEDEWRTTFLRNFEASEFKDYSVAEYTAYAKRRGANAIELGVLQDCLVKFNGRFEMQQYLTLTKKEQEVWNHYIARIPPPSEIEPQMAVFAKSLQQQLQSSLDEQNIIGLVAWCHQEIMRISPCKKFGDNDKFARIIMNTVFQHLGYNPVIFPTKHQYSEAIQRDRRMPGDFAIYLANVIHKNFDLRFKTFA